MSTDERQDVTGERALIQVHRTETVTTFEAVDLGICTAKVVQQDGGWVVRCYTGPEEYRAEAPRPSRTDAEDAAVRHTLLLV